MQYDKPHLEISQQVEKLASNGLRISDRDRAARFLETVGYYRVSAYAYPFRELLADKLPSPTIPNASSISSVSTIPAFGFSSAHTMPANTAEVTCSPVAF